MAKAKLGENDVAQEGVGQRAPRTVKRGRGHAVWLRDEAYDALRQRAKALGVSMSAFIENALLDLKAPLPLTASIVKPLAAVGYRLTQIAEALESGDIQHANADVEDARRLVADALLPLAREHVREARELSQTADGWNG